MADCLPVRTAKAVVTDINAAVVAETLSQQFTAVYSFGSEMVEFEDINDDSLTVDVVPTSDQGWSLYSPGSYRHDINIAIGIRRRISPTGRNDDGSVDNAAITLYANLLYEITAMFLPGRNITTETQISSDPTRDPIVKLYDPELIKEGLYFGWVHLPFAFKENAS